VNAEASTPAVRARIDAFLPLVARSVLVAIVAAALALAAGCTSDGTADGPRSGSPADERSTASTQRAVRSERASGPSAGCEVVPAAVPGTTDQVLASGGVERRYQLILPAGYDGTEALPVVFGLHSLTIDYHVVAPMAGFADTAATHEFIGVSPSGLLGPSGQPYWNAAPVPDNADVTFMGDLLDHLESTLCVDKAKVFSIGMSNGAQLSSLIACRLRGRIAAIAPISGVEFEPPCVGPPVGVIAFHGALDPIVPYAGGGLSSVRIADLNLYHGNMPRVSAATSGVDAAMAGWADHNGCDPEPVEERVSPEVRRRTWRHCDASTVLYVVDNGGHAWPGKPQPSMEASYGHGTSDVDATDLAFELFFGSVS